MVFIRPDLSERIPKIMSPVAQSRIIKLVAVISPLLITSGVASCQSSNALLFAGEGKKPLVHAA